MTGRPALAHRGPAVRPRRRVRPARRRTATSSTACTPTRRCRSGSVPPASTRPPARPATATSPRNAWSDHRRRAHVRDRRQQQAEHFRPPNAIVDVPRQRHLRAVQHVQHAQADPRAVAAGPGQRGATSTSTSGRCSTTCSARRTRPTPRARHLLHAAAVRAAARRRRARPGAAARSTHRLRQLLVLPGHRHRDQHQADGLDLLLRGHHADGQPVHAVRPDVDRSAASRSPRPRRTRSSDTTTLTIAGSPSSGSWTIRVRIPAWATGAIARPSTAPALNVAADAGHATRPSPAPGPPGDALTVRLPMTRAGRADQRQPRRRARSSTARPCCPATTAAPHAVRRRRRWTVASITRTSTDRAGVHRHGQRSGRQRSARSTTRTASTTPSTGARRPGRRRTARRARTAWSTSPAASCSASRTCPPPTAAWRCSGATTGPPTTTGSSCADGDALKLRNVQQRQGPRRREHVDRRRRPRPAVGRHRHRRPPLDRWSTPATAPTGSATSTRRECSALQGNATAQGRRPS